MRLRRLIHAILVLTALASGATTLGADEGKVVRVVRWSEEQSAGRPVAGRIVEDPRRVLGEVLMLPCPQGERTRLSLLTLDQPAVGPPAYLLRGRVRYEHVKGQGYLELLNYFPEHPRPFFTRTLSDTGPQQSLEGTSDWRSFQLPFFVTGDQLTTPQAPTKLELNLAVPAGGLVYLGDLELVQLDKGLPHVAGGAWWSGRATGLIGGIAGTLLGCLGGLVGTLTGMGKARQLVMAVISGCMAFGFVALLAGAAAIALGQPYHVYYPLLGIGGISLIVFGAGRANVWRQYEQREMRRMEALDVAG